MESASDGTTAPVKTRRHCPACITPLNGLPAQEVPIKLRLNSRPLVISALEKAYPSIAEFVSLGLLIGAYTASDNILPKASFKRTVSEALSGCIVFLILASASSIGNIGLDSWLHKSIIGAPSFALK